MMNVQNKHDSNAISRQNNPELLSAILENLPHSFFFLNCDFQYITFNQAHASDMKILYGADIETGKSILDSITVDEDRSAIGHHLTKVLVGESVTTSEIWGNSVPCQKYFDVTYGAVYNSENNITGIIAHLRDITDRKQAENLLKESEEKFRKAFMTSPDCVNINRLKDGMYVLLSPGFTAILGYTEDEIIGKTSIEKSIWYNIADRTRWVDELNQKGEVRNFEAQFRAKNGQLVYGLVSAAIIELAGVKHVISITRDITERKLAELVLKESEEKFRNIFVNSVVGKSLTYIDGRMMTNKAFCDMLGYSEEELNQLKWQEITHPEDIVFKQKETNLIMSGVKSSAKFQSRFIHKNGEVVWVDISTVLQRDNNNEPLYFITSINDITVQKLAEEKLQKNYDLLSKLTAQVPGVVYQYRLYPDGHSAFPYSSRGMYDIYEVTSEEVYTDASPVFTRIHPDDFDVIAQTINESAQNQTNYHSEFRVVLPEQGLRWRRCDAKPELLEDGSTLWHGIISDITDRKIAEEILQESEDRHRSLFQRNSSVMFILNPDNGNIVDANPAACNYYGWTYSEMCQKNITDINMLSKDAVKNLLDKTKDEQQNHLYLNHRLANGDVRDVEVYATPIKYGSTVFIYSIVHDITDRKKAEKQLRESEEKLSTLFSSMTELVVIHELVHNEQNEVINYIITDCNNAFSKMIRIKKEDIVGKLATEVYKMDKAPFLEIYSQVAITGQSYEHSVYYEPLDKHLLISAVSTGKNLFSTIITDITTIKQFQEEILSKNKELETYLYVASHDLRSPLVNIQGFSQRLKKQFNQLQLALLDADISDRTQWEINQITEEAVPRTLNFILSNVTKMDSLINNLLQISRTGRLTLSLKRIDMNQLLNTIIAAHNYQISELSAEVVLHNLADCYGDENQLSQLFSNIIDNAIKYRDGNRRLEIGIKSLVHGKKVIYSVSDNGRGINSRHLEKIWDVFFRIDPAASEMGEGIGLSIAKTIADKHKGKVWVESEEGKGSTFYIELQHNDFFE